MIICLSLMQLGLLLQFRLSQCFFFSNNDVVSLRIQMQKPVINTRVCTAVRYNSNRHNPCYRSVATYSNLPMYLVNYTYMLLWHLQE